MRQVLSLSASGLSHPTKVTDNIPEDVGDKIGAAPKSSRPKWTALAEALASNKVNALSSFAILSKLSAELSSDDRLELFMREIARRGARPSEGREATPVPGVTTKYAGIFGAAYYVPVRVIEPHCRPLCDGHYDFSLWDLSWLPPAAILAVVL